MTSKKDDTSMMKKKKKKENDNVRKRWKSWKKVIDAIQLLGIRLGLYNNRKKQMQMLIAFLFVNILIWNIIPGQDAVIQDATRIDKVKSYSGTKKEIQAKSLDEAMQLHGIGYGIPPPNEKELLKRNHMTSISLKPRTSVFEKLAHLEMLQNQGWNSTTLKVQPLGQFGYVRRDLPVYKDGFATLKNVDIVERPKSGLFSASELQHDTYNAILCLSFNTDHCFDPNEYAAIGGSRKVNRILGLRDVVWSKHKFCKTIASATRGIQDPELLSFTFPCWIMPQDYDRMLQDSKTFNIERWIAKPRSLGAGMGIYVVDNMAQLQSEQYTKNVVQSYLENPHLIQKAGLDGNEGKFKWDLRTYVLCTSVHPIRAYVYSRGLVRISTSPYTKDCKNVTACLTNTSLNKKVEGAQLKDITWSLKKMSEYISAHDNQDWDEVMLRIQRAIGMTLLSTETEFLRNMNPVGYKCENCYQLLGVDVLLDESLQPKIVEINGEPSLKLTPNGKTHYDITKRAMAKDLVNIVFNKKSTHGELDVALRRWASTSPGTDKNTLHEIGTDHLKYLMDTMREQSSMGGFLPVYPNRELSGIYGRYLNEQYRRESVEYSKKPDIPYAHADGRRLRIHEMTTAIQYQTDYPVADDFASHEEFGEEPSKTTIPKQKLRASDTHESTADSMF